MNIEQNNKWEARITLLHWGGGKTKKKHEQPIKTDGVRIRPCVLT